MQMIEAASSNLLGRAGRYCVFVLTPIVFGVLAVNADGQTIYKVNNLHNLNLDTSWSSADGGSGHDFPFSTIGELWFGSGMGGDLSLNTGGGMTVGALRVDNTTFDPTANHSVQISGPAITINGLSGRGIYLQNTVGGTLTVNAGINVNSSQAWEAARNYTIGGAVQLNGNTLTFRQSAGAASINGAIAGTGSIVAESGSTLLSGNNSYSGGTAIGGGTLRVNALSGIGSGSLAVGGGSTFRYEGGGSETTTRALNLNSGSSTIDVVQANASLTFNSGGTRNQAFTKAGAGHLSINGGFSGSASISVDGGTLRLTGSSVHSGTTTVNNAGVLVIDGTHTGGGDYEIQAGGKLMGSGSIGANVSVASGATLAAGNSIGTLNIVGNLTVGGAFEWEMDSVLNIADLVNVDGNVDLTGANLTIVELNAFPAGQKFTLLSYTGDLDGTFSGIDPAMWTINYADSEAGVNGGSYGKFVTLSAVPEPSALLFVGATVAVGFLRRRRSI